MFSEKKPEILPICAHTVSAAEASMFRNIPICASLEDILSFDSSILTEPLQLLYIKPWYHACSRIVRPSRELSTGFSLARSPFYPFIKYLKVLLSNTRFILLTVKLLYTPAIT